MRRDFRIAGVFDTETTNIKDGKDSFAFPVLFTCNDLTKVSIDRYFPNCEGEEISLFRNESECIAWLHRIISIGIAENYIPIVCAYNLMFDLQPILFDLRQEFEMQTCAQTSQVAYTLDLLDEDRKKLLRFWDVYHLEMRGLEAMGKSCGLEKAVDEWDYSKVRTPETPLTEEEIGYARRDVQVIPAYLRMILESNDFLKASDLGSSVLTKTSIIRMFANRRIGQKEYVNANGKRVKLRYAYSKLCNQEAAKSYESYAVRKACFRGGLTFTSAKNANETLYDVANLDASSMHHTFICGRYLPVRFRIHSNDAILKAAQSVMHTRIEDVLTHYERPFDFAFNACFSFYGLRLKHDSVFEREGIAILSEGKFQRKPTLTGEPNGACANARNAEADASLRAYGFGDYAKRPVFAFGKLYQAERCDVFLTELEFWNMCQVYEWDFFEVSYGESTMKHQRPPDYVVMQSMHYFELKKNVKEITERYEESKPYPFDISKSIPRSIRERIFTGEESKAFLDSYYNATVKGAFNSIFGTQAQDELKPDFLIDIEAIFNIDNETRVTPENFEAMQPSTHKVIYTYGTRIAGAARMHLVIALILLDKAFPNMEICGGDTDSIYLSIEGATNETILGALQPLHNATEMAISKTTQRVKDCFPHEWSSLEGVGKFEVKSKDGFDRYEKMCETTNKTRVALDMAGNAHLTCAGIPRPERFYNMESWINGMLAKGHFFETIVPLAIGYNVTVKNDVSHTLARTKPLSMEKVKRYIVDYLGTISEVETHKSIALYESDYEIGATDKRVNHENVAYLRRNGKTVNTKPKLIDIDKQGQPVMRMMDEWGGFNDF